MARPARGADNLEWAREVPTRAQTFEQLRQQARPWWATASASHAVGAGART